MSWKIYKSGQGYYTRLDQCGNGRRGGGDRLLSTVAETGAVDIASAIHEIFWYSACAAGGICRLWHG